MAPHANKWLLLDGAHKLQATVIVTTSELSSFTHLCVMIKQPGNSRVNSVRDLYYCWLHSCQLNTPDNHLAQWFKAMQIPVT